MSLDTREKRAGAIMLGLPWRGILPVPDSSLSQGDRQEVLFLCPAILAAAEVVVTQYEYIAERLGGLRYMVERLTGPRYEIDRNTSPRYNVERA